MDLSALDFGDAPSGLHFPSFLDFGREMQFLGQPAHQFGHLFGGPMTGLFNDLIESHGAKLHRKSSTLKGQGSGNVTIKGLTFFGRAGKIFKAKSKQD